MWEKFKIRIVQMPFSPKLQTCQCKNLKQKEKGYLHDFLHEIITYYKNNQVNAWFRRNTREQRDVTCCWFAQKPFSAQLNKLEQHAPFTRRSDHEVTGVISDYICYLVDDDGVLYINEFAVTNHQLHRLPSSLMNSIKSKEDVELFHMHNTEELYIQDHLKHDHINAKVMW